MDKLEVPELEVIPTKYLVAHGSDLFHESVSVNNLKIIFKTMNNARHHIFEITTKRIERAACIANEFEWSDNIHLGVAVESGRYRWRLDYLRDIPAKYRFVSACPMLGSFPNANLNAIDYVGIVEETWGMKRPMDIEWAEDLIRQCDEQGVAHTLNESYTWEAN
jgi:protein gp37|tara:strand:- start:452 stop:943 length:492 start_codon:yes stop_codon:yes gene_type:complete